MSRVLTTENATVTREIVSPQTVIDWDPTTGAGTITYRTVELLFVNGEFIKSVPMNNFTVELQRMIEKTLKVEVEPGITVDVPGGLVMLAFKKAFEEALAEANAGYRAPEPVVEQPAEGEVP